MNLRNFLLTTTVALLYSVVPAGLTLAQRPAPPIRYTLNYYDTDGYVVATASCHFGWQVDSGLFSD